MIRGGVSEDACRDAPTGKAHDPRNEEGEMAVCEVCGNDYDKSFELTAAGTTHTFDSFECAIHAIAPVCKHCGCKVIGHGIEADGSFYCCAHCARESGAAGAVDRI
jgi:Rieske Fe-S protein